MGFIPKGARWYLADIVEEIKVEGFKRSLVHINYVLIEAKSPESAYKKAHSLGRQYNNSYENTEGKRVVCRFRGLRDLNVIHDELEHGVELIYARKERQSESKIRRLISKKRDLGVFEPIQPCKSPNFMPKRVAEELARPLQEGGKRSGR